MLNNRVIAALATAAVITHPVANADDVEMFAEGVVSTALPEFATSFSPDGSEVYFNRMSEDRKELRLWYSTMVDGAWTEAQPLPFSDGNYRDVDPFVSPDGNRLYFSSTRPLSGDEAKDYDLWYSERTDDTWGEPINIGPRINTASHEIYSTLSHNGNIYYTAFDQGFENVSIYRAEWRDGRFATPERLVIGSGDLRLTNPTIAPDESYLVMVADPAGQADLYVSYRRANGSWCASLPLAAEVNSTFTEFAPGFSPDGSRLFFTSERPGMVPAADDGGRPPGDIYSIDAVKALPPPPDINPAEPLP